MPRSYLLVAAALAAGPTIALGQSPAPTLSCPATTTAVGALTASGKATLLLLPTRSVDTTTIVVSSVAGVSDSGYQSAVRRHLARCTLDSATASRIPEGARVTVPILFKNRLANFYRVALPKAWAQSPDSQTAPAIFGLKEVEEGPATLECRPFDGGDSTKSTWRWRAITTAIMAVIGPDGHVEPDHLLMRQRTTPEAEQDVRRFLPRCANMPARIHGRPVRVLVGQDLYLRVRWHE